MRRIVAFVLSITLMSTLYACTDKAPGMNSSFSDKESETPSSEPISQVESEVSTAEITGQDMLNEFFVMIGTDVSQSDIEDIAKNIGLYINYKNSGTGIRTYRIAADKGAANVNRPEIGSYITVSFNTLNDSAITEITYFDEERMVSGYWSPDTGYLLADYNYPQVVYHDTNTDTLYSRTPVNDANEIINYSFDGDPGENTLEALFVSITSETTEEDLLTFVDSNGLSYNSRGVGNEQVISYCYEIGDKYGENGSYITFSTDNGYVTTATYRYYPATYRKGYKATFYSENYAANHSVPSGFVLESEAGLEKYALADELLAQLHSLS